MLDQAKFTYCILEKKLKKKKKKTSKKHGEKQIKALKLLPSFITNYYQ